MLPKGPKSDCQEGGSAAGAAWARGARGAQRVGQLVCCLAGTGTNPGWLAAGQQLLYLAEGFAHRVSLVPTHYVDLAFSYKKLLFSGV